MGIRAKQIGKEVRCLLIWGSRLKGVVVQAPGDDIHVIWIHAKVLDQIVFGVLAWADNSLTPSDKVRHDLSLVGVHCHALFGVDQEDHIVYCDHGPGRCTQGHVVVCGMEESRAGDTFDPSNFTHPSLSSLRQGEVVMAAP